MFTEISKKSNLYNPEKNLNTSQKNAILIEKGPAKIIAGAGTGKTTVLIEHFKFLVQQKKINSQKIIAFAFNNRAVKEMQNRIKLELGITPNYINTFHSFALNFIKEEFLAANLSNSFNVLDDESSESLIRQLKHKFLKQYQNDSIELQVWKNRLSELKPRDVFSQIILTKTTVAKFLEQYTEDDFKYQSNKNFQKYEIEYMKYVFIEFVLIQIQYASLNFIDLLNYCVLLLHKELDIRKKWKNRFSHVLVDEFQDIDHKQYEMIKYLASEHQNIFIVGDPDQCIYEWRNADVKIFLHHFDADFPNAKTILLNDNYRSGQKILDIANNIINKNSRRLLSGEKKLIASKNIFAEIKFKPFMAEDDEVKWIINTIQALKYQKINPNEIAILYRSNYLSMKLEFELKKQNIEYTLFGKSNFFKAKEVKIVFSYLATIFMNSSTEFLNIINFPTRTAGDAYVSELMAKANEEGKSVLSYFLENEVTEKLQIKKFQQSLQYYVQKFENLKDTRDKTEYSKLIWECLTKFNVIQKFENFDAHNPIKNKERLENIKALVEIFVKDISFENYANSIDTFFTTFVLDSENTLNQGQIILSTVHAAKGLEFSVVFLPFMNEGIFPSKRSVESKNLEEEYRLAYVAITRAKEKLYISNHTKQWNWSSIIHYINSRFIEDGKIR